MVIKNALLQRHQPIDILHVAHTARHCGDHTVDLSLGESGQRQHVGGNVPTVGGNLIGGRLHVRDIAARCRQRGQGRLAEQHAHVGIQTDVAHAFDQFHRQHRMPTQFEELVMTAYLLDAQQLGPQPGQAGFRQALRGLVLTPGIGLGHGQRQCLAIKLAVGGQRESLQADKSARQHVLGQRQAQLFTQPGSVRFQVCRADDIGHQALVARFVFTHHDHRFTHAFASAQSSFDLAQFDTEATNFHLFIVTAQVFQAAVRQPTTQIARAVHSRPGFRGEWIIEKARRVQFIAIEVATGHACPAHVQLARRAWWQRMAISIQQVQLQVGNALANRAGANALRVSRLQRVIGHMHCGFGDAVHVYQLCSSIHFSGVPRFEHRRFQRFTTENHLTQRMCLLFFALSRNQLAERTWRLVEHRDTGTAQQPIEVFWRAADQLRHDQQAAAVQQCAPDFPDREVEGERVEQRPHVLFAEAEPVFRGRKQSCNVAMLDHYALGQTGGAGGIDHIGKVAGLDRYLRIAHGFVLQVGVVEIDQRHFR
ncbi:Uncharacterized protein AC517_2033 [Pseudomonas syringae pv. syringae]|nr:Uncharacterized protein AC517_2033 [Pseudomonas syringae pv. syringae]